MTTLSPLQMAGYLSRAGFPAGQIAIGVAVGLAESSGRTDATHQNNNGSTDYGVWQINDKAHPEFGSFAGNNWADPATNAKMAFSVWNAAGQSWRPWTTFTGSQYASNLIQGQSAQAQLAANPSSFVPVAYQPAGAPTQSIAAPFTVAGVTMDDPVWKTYIGADGKPVGTKFITLPGKKTQQATFVTIPQSDGTTIQYLPIDDLSRYAYAVHAKSNSVAASDRISTVTLKDGKAVGYIRDGKLTGSVSDNGGAVDQGLNPFGGGTGFDVTKWLWIGGGGLAVLLGLVMLFKVDISGVAPAVAHKISDLAKATDSDDPAEESEESDDESD